MRNILIAIFLFTGCMAPVKKPVKPDKLDIVRKKRDLYLSLYEVKDGAIGGCDGLLFGSMYSLGGASSISIPEFAEIYRGDGRTHYADDQAYDGNDKSIKWHRTPSRDCYPKRSGSECSRDMLLGAFQWGYYTDQPRVIEQTLRYLAANEWFCGKGDEYATFIPPSLRAFAASLIDKSEFSQYAALPFFWPEMFGYQAHLQILQIIALAHRQGQVSEHAFRAAATYAAREKRNALFQFAYHLFFDGDYTDAINALLDESIFPADRLPNTSDRCEEYLWQRDQKDKGWKPCKGKGLHSGVDLVFTVFLIERFLKDYPEGFTHE